MKQAKERKVTYVRFPYGRLVATRRVIDELDGQTISRLLTRHLHCDWGDICDGIIDNDGNVAIKEAEKLEH